MAKEFKDATELGMAIRRDFVRTKEDLLNALGQEIVTKIRKSTNIQLRARTAEDKLTITAEAKGEQQDFIEKLEIFNKATKYVSDNYGNILRQKNII